MAPSAPRPARIAVLPEFSPSIWAKMTWSAGLEPRGGPAAGARHAGGVRNADPRLDRNGRGVPVAEDRGR